jgi:NDP-sugar pyrophosphorylase family protein
MKAMILAAGLGTRLRPLTDTRPKALVELAGRTLLEITLTRLRTFGITEFIINTHHFADQVIDYLKSNNNFGMRIEISREDVLLDTGGGLKKAAWFFLENSSPHEPARPDSSQIDEPFLLHNVDIISTIDLARMLQFHKEHHALATLAVQSRESSRQLLFNNDLQLSGRRTTGTVPSGTAIPGCTPQMTVTPNPSSTASPPAETAANCHSERSEESAFSQSQSAGSKQLHALAFSGIHLISPRLLPLLTEEGIFSIIPSYLRLAAQNEKILAFRADQYYWRDLGRPADLAQAALDAPL